MLSKNMLNRRKAVHLGKLVFRQCRLDEDSFHQSVVIVGVLLVDQLPHEALQDSSVLFSEPILPTRVRSPYKRRNAVSLKKTLKPSTKLAALVVHHLSRASGPTEPSNGKLSSHRLRSLVRQQHGEVVSRRPIRDAEHAVTSSRDVLDLQQVQGHNVVELQVLGSCHRWTLYRRRRRSQARRAPPPTRTSNRVVVDAAQARHRTSGVGCPKLTWHLLTPRLMSSARSGHGSGSCGGSSCSTGGSYTSSGSSGIISSSSSGGPASASAPSSWG